MKIEKTPEPIEAATLKGGGRMDHLVSAYLGKYKLSDSAQSFLGRSRGHFINGAWCESAAHYDKIDPCTGGVLTQHALGDASDIDLAVRSARSALRGEWATMSPLARDELIRKLADTIEAHAEELATLECLDVGKPLKLARVVDIASAAKTFRYFAGWASKIGGRQVNASASPFDLMGYTLKSPVGVVAAITAWNFPLSTLSWKMGAALAAGCTAVIKPSELASLSALRFAELAKEAGFPNGVLNVVTGDGAQTGTALTSHPGIDKITFTGSSRTGSAIGARAGADIKRLTLELGGKSAAIVLKDANIKAAAVQAADGVFFNSGQTCDACTRVLVEDEIYDEFMAALVEVTDGLPVGPGLDPGSFVGPLISERQMQKVLGYIEGAKAEGATLLTGGQRNGTEGYFVNPTVFDNVSTTSRLWKEEVFGPVLAVRRFSGDEEAVALANDSDYGLAATIYSNDLTRVHRMIKRLEAGSIYVNRQSTLDPAMPFGGMKKSGYGKDMGSEQIEDYLTTRAVWITLSE